MNEKELYLQQDLKRLKDWYTIEKDASGFPVHKGRGDFIYGKFTDNKFDLIDDELINEEIRLMEESDKKGVSINLERLENLKIEYQRRNLKTDIQTLSDILQQKTYSAHDQTEARNNFKRLSDILETGKSQTLQNEKLGDISLDKGHTGKEGYGLLHIIEGKYIKDKINENEITALLYKVTDATENGFITDSINIRKKNDSERIGIEKDGIIAIVSRRKGTHEKFVITGYEINNKKEEATEAIRTVIARYGSTPEFSDFRKQVGAVVSSLQVSHQSHDKSSEIETARKTGYVQGVCECVAAIGDDLTLGKKLLTEMNVTKDLAKKYANPETFKTLEQGIFASKPEQNLEQTQGIKR
jgi:hypothetical protein